jgi:tetratricopeptide (TPR) repeat protein
MKKILIIFALVLISKIGFSQDFQTDFTTYFQTNDTVNQLKVLQMWEAAKPNDAEWYTSYYNYHFTKSKRETIVMTTTEPQSEGFVLEDSLGQVAGYLGSQIHFDRVEFNKSIVIIDKGIKRYPNRLDMRFGKIYALGQIADWDAFTTEIIKTIQYSTTNDNKWTWTNNEHIQDSKNFMLRSVQDYQIQLYNTEDDALLLNMRAIANEVLKYYPNHIESLSNLSVTYLLTGDYDKGIETLLRAEKISPKDYIILANIAHGYNLKQDYKKAIEYYEKVVLYGDENAIEFAKQQLAGLRK